MPFVQRVVNPVYIARSQQRSNKSDQCSVARPGCSGINNSCDAGCGADHRPQGPDIPCLVIGGRGRPAASSAPKVVHDHELEAVTNLTLSNALRQLASLVLVANDIFTELNQELRSVTERTSTIKQRITVLEVTVQEHDPKLVPVRKYNKRHSLFIHIHILVFDRLRDH